MGVIFYLIWQINQITKAPEINLIYPQTDLTVYQDSIIITGSTEAEVILKINDQNILLSEENKFSQTLSLQLGLNVITIEGKKKYSKTQVIERKIIYENNLLECKRD